MYQDNQYLNKHLLSLRGRMWNWKQLKHVVTCSPNEVKYIRHHRIFWSERNPQESSSPAPNTTPQIIEMRQTGPIGMFCWLFWGLSPTCAHGVIFPEVPVWFQLAHTHMASQLHWQSAMYTIDIGWFIFLFLLLRGASLSSGTRLLYWSQAAMKRQKCCILMRAQEWDKSKAQEKATTLQGVSPSHLIKFCTVLQSHCSGGDLKHLKQWSRICCSLHFFLLLREDQNALSMGRWEGCGLLAWANWHRKKWGSGRTLYQSVNIRWKQQGCIMLPNSLKQGRQGKRKYHCLATAFQSITDGLCHSAGPWSFHPTAGKEANTSKSKCMNSSQVFMRLNSKAMPQKFVLLSSFSKEWEGDWIFAHWFVGAC